MIAADGLLPQADGAGAALGACFTASAAVGFATAAAAAVFAPFFGADPLSESADFALEGPPVGFHAAAVALRVDYIMRVR